MGDKEMRDLAEIIREKATELAARAGTLVDHARTDGEVEFSLAMVRESESAVGFWVDQLEKAARA